MTDREWARLTRDLDSARRELRHVCGADLRMLGEDVHEAANIALSIIARVRTYVDDFSATEEAAR